MPANPDIAQWTLATLLVITFVLLLTEKLRVDLTAVLIVIALPILGILEPEEAFSGFSSEPAIVVAAVFILSGAFYYTGLSNRLGILIARFAGRGFFRVLTVLMLSVAGLSAFTHHLTITAVMLPVTLKLSQEQEIPPSRLLMPMSFAASLGTTITILGAPAFLVADRLLEQAGRPGLGVFSIAPLGLSITLAGTLMTLLAGQALLPDRRSNGKEDDQYRLDGYYTEIMVESDSDLIGKTIKAVEERKDWNLKVVTLIRSGRVRERPHRRKEIKTGDVMLARTAPEDLAAIQEVPGLALHPVVKYSRHADVNGKNAQKAKGEIARGMVQAVIGPGSELIGRTIGQVDFNEQYGVLVVGIWRRRGWLRTELSRVRLKAGDVLVLMGDPLSFSRLRKSDSFLLLTPFSQEGYRRHKAPLAAAIMLGTVLVAAFEIVPIQVALAAGAITAVLTGCLTIQQAYKSIDTRIYVFIAGAIPLGLAFVKTGLSEKIADWISRYVGSWSPMFVLFLLFGISALLTQLMSDAGTTVLLGPVAIGLAVALGQPPERFVVTVAMAAVASFLTPIGHHGNLLIYGPGGYEFRDFLRAGIPLTVVTAILVVLLAIVLWPN